MKTNHTLQQDRAIPEEWLPPEAGDHHSPRPALNSLANGGCLPRGGEVTLDDLVGALSTRLRLPRSIGEPLAKLAMGRLLPAAEGARGKRTYEEALTLVISLKLTFVRAD
jgi:Peroxidase, family 2